MVTIKHQFFEGNMDSKKYIEILNNSKREMNELIPDKWILQWDNDSKHFSNITSEYRDLGIENQKYIALGLRD